MAATCSASCPGRRRLRESRSAARGGGRRAPRPGPRRPTSARGGSRRAARAASSGVLRPTRPPQQVLRASGSMAPRGSAVLKRQVTGRSAILVPRTRRRSPACGAGGLVVSERRARCQGRAYLRLRARLRARFRVSLYHAGSITDRGGQAVPPLRGALALPVVGPRSWASRSAAAAAFQAMLWVLPLDLIDWRSSRGPLTLRPHLLPVPGAHPLYAAPSPSARPTWRRLRRDRLRRRARCRAAGVRHSGHG